ncbi:MAG: hypothetical protein MUQ43_10155 [Reinekea forsetii]|uniref:hypothetical protein n=1 Tax=Reinekea sp. TaxID=1970455 RepID=UPI00257A42BF|nr:hypothetical protein [Reinekea sp.]MDO7674775.1 hypothetical protein [Reinekea forsetii]
MKRSATLTLFCLLALSACSNRAVDTETTRCAFADSPRTPAPAFICDPDISGFPVTVLLASEPSAESVSERINRTLTGQIALWADNWSQAWYQSEEGQQAANELLLKILADKARVVRSRASPTGTLWLMVGLPMSVAEVRSLTLATLPLR